MQILFPNSHQGQHNRVGTLGLGVGEELGLEEEAFQPKYQGIALRETSRMVHPIMRQKTT